MAFAGLFCQSQCAQNRANHGKPCGVIALSRTRHGHHAVFAFAHGIVQAGASKEGGDVITRPPGVWTTGAISGQSRVNEFGVCLEQTVGIQTKFLLSFGQQITHEDVGLLRQLTDQLGTFGLIQGDSDRLLAAIVDIELKVVVLECVVKPIAFDRATHTAHGITADRLDFDHPSAHVRQHSPGTRRSHPIVNFQYYDIV